MPENIDDKCYDDCPHAIWDYLCCKHSNTKCDCGGQRGIEGCELKLNPAKCEHCDQCGKYFEPLIYPLKYGTLKGTMTGWITLMEEALQGKSLFTLFETIEHGIAAFKKAIIEAEGHDCSVEKDKS